MQTKNELRKIMKALLAALPPDQFTAEGERAAGRLAETDAWKNSRRVLLYCSMPGEIAMRPLISLAFHDGKEPYFPKTAGNLMRFYRVDSPDGPWTRGAFGIREPAYCGDERLFRAPDIASEPFLVVTPGLAFDRAGCRLGRGGGCYDRFFAGLDASHTAYLATGYCLACQIVSEVPIESTDKKLNALCTAEEFLIFNHMA
jgi:5-formyltetrahydrofolate cyclo-ligase